MTPEKKTTLNQPTHVEASAPLSQIFTGTFIWKSFKHWWKVIIPVTLMLTLTVNALIFWLHVPQYKAFTRLRIKAAPDSILGDARGATKNSFAENQLAIIRSELVLEPVVGHKDVARIPELAAARDPVAQLAKGLKVAPIGKSEFYELSYSAPDPKHALLVVDEVVKSYLALFGGIEDKRITKIRDLLLIEKAKREGQVQMLEDTLRGLARKAQDQLKAVVPPSTLDMDPGQILSSLNTGATSQQITTIQSQRAQAHIDLLILQNQIEDLEKTDASTPIEIPATTVDRLLDQNPSIVAMNTTLQAERAKLSNVEQLAAEKDPNRNRSLRQHARTIESLEAQVAKLRADLRPTIETELRAQQEHKRAENLNQLKSQQRNLETVIAALDERMQEEIDAGRDNEVASATLMEIEFARMELEYAQQLLGTINGRLMNLDVQSNDLSQVEHVFERARVPVQPIEVIPFRMMGLASVFTLSLPFLLSLLWEHRVRRISSVQDLEANTCRLPVVAEVTRLPIQTVGRSTSLRLQHDLWLFEESVETLRTCLLLSEPGREVQVIAVTSAAAREGKTSVASQLAVSLAGATGQPTLLIDGDMRSPDIHSIFDVASDVGLTNVLAQEVPLEEAVCSTWQQNLDILPAGQLSCSPHNLVKKDAFKRVIDTARSKYRFIVIDTPPVLAASEALIMAQEADAALLCAMRALSRSHQVRAAHGRLHQAGANPVGFVLNGVPTQSYYYKYGKYTYNSN